MKKNTLKLIHSVSFAFMLLTLFSCSTTYSRKIESMDRSFVNSDIMSLDQLSEVSTISPHTSLKSKGSNSSGGCSVCAH